MSFGRANSAPDGDEALLSWNDDEAFGAGHFPRA